MADDGYVAKIDRPHASLDYQWTLRVKGQAPKPLSLSGYDHAVAIADVYVAFKLTGLLQSFQCSPGKQGVEQDAEMRLSLSELPLDWEVERSPRKKGIIASKAARYAKLSPRHVIFTATSPSHAENILDELPRDKGTRFIVTLHEYILLDPLMQGYVSANRIDELQHLESILSGVRTGGA